MKISRVELDHLIEAEINEIFGLGKKKETKEYPASELATIIRGLDDASKMSGAELTSSQREAIVDELTGVLEDEGFVIKENERLFTGEEDVVVTHQNAPKLKVFLDTVAQKNPKVFKQLLGLFNRSALDISPVVKNIIPSITTVADPEPDEDQTATIVAEPVAAPDDEDLDVGDIAGSDQEIAASADAIASTDDEDQAATIVTEPVAAPDLEDEEEADDFDEFFLSLDDETIEEFFKSVPREDFKWGTMRFPDEVLSHLFDAFERRSERTPRDTRNARQYLEDDQYAALETAADNDLSVEDLEPILRNAEQKMLALAKDILAKRSRLTEHKQLKRMKVLAGIK